MTNKLEQSQPDQLSRQKATIYHILKTSLNNFKKAPSELEENELNYVQQQAEKQYEIEQLVLGSDKASSVIIPETLVASSIEDIKRRYESEEEYIQDLENNKLSEELLAQSLYRELKVEAVLDKISSNVADVSDIDIKLYYFLHKDKFTQPESRVVRHILITINEEMEENTRQNAFKKIRDIQKRVMNKPKRFSEQAYKHSECPTALNGGLIGNIPRGQLFPELDEVLFSMKEGKISDIIESEMGFHLIYCETIYQDGPVEFKRAAEMIKEKLLTKRRRICQRSWLKELASGKSTSKKDDGE